MSNEPKAPPLNLTREQEAEITRNAVLAFGDMMHRAMLLNADKPGWAGDADVVLMQQVNKHVGRVSEGILNGDADVAFMSCIHAANYLMMVADNIYRDFGGVVGANTPTLPAETCGEPEPIGYGLQTDDNGVTTVYPCYKNEDVTGPENFWSVGYEAVVQAEAKRLNEPKIGDTVRLLHMSEDDQYDEAYPLAAGITGTVIPDPEELNGEGLAVRWDLPGGSTNWTVPAHCVELVARYKP